MSPAGQRLLMLGIDLGLQRIEAWLVEGLIDKWTAEGKTDEQIADLLQETFANEVAQAKADSAAKRAAQERAGG